MVSPVSVEPDGPSAGRWKHTESEVCPGVAMTLTSTPAADSTSPSCSAGAASVAVDGIGGTDRSPGQLVQPGRTCCVVGVAVGDEDEFHGPRAGKGLEVRLVQRSRVHHHGAGRTGRPQHVGVGPVQAHRPGIGGQDELGQARAALEDGAGS
jgi:hypothetical protein